MQKLNRLCCMAALAAVCVGAGVAQQANQTVPDRSGQLRQGVDILSDTQGVNFQPYLQSMMRAIYAQWVPLVSHEEQATPYAPGETQIRLTIEPDGTIAAMHLDSSSHDVVLNRAAWGSVARGGQLPPLPQGFHGPNLELRIHFIVNQQQ